MTRTERKEAIAQLWQAGMKRREIATTLNLTFGGVSASLVRQGLHTPKKHPTPELKAAVLAEAKTGNVLELAVKYNLCRTTLYMWKPPGCRTFRKISQAKLNRS